MSGCAAYFNQPTHTQEARFGEETNSFEYLQNLRPQVPIVVGVYKFKDQTGQYKQVDAGVSYSTAVTQGATTILIKALEDSKWFIPIERENISNLLNERQIIRATRQEENQKNNSNVEPDLPPLLFAGVLLEGGIVSYDTNIITGGSGLRYFGAGGSNQYREDRITIYLRAVSTSTGKILKTVYISKTILSQAIDINLYRYVKTRRLLEIETGVSQNEPVQLAVKDAIDKAVESLVIEGLKDNLWQAQEGIEAINEVFIAYEKEKDEAGETALFNRRLLNYRGKTSLAVAPYGTFFDGDYDNSRIDIGGEVIYKYYAGKPNINISMAAGLLTLSNTNVFKNDFISLSTNLEYTILPYDKVSPFLYAGVGGLSDIGFNDFYFKTQYGGGLEFIPIKNLGFRIFAEQNILFNDELDNMIQGKQNDYYWKFGAGINIYLSEF
jgi:curli production assembly/transport component CsgG